MLPLKGGNLMFFCLNYTITSKQIMPASQLEAGRICIIFRAIVFRLPALDFGDVFASVF